MYAIVVTGGKQVKVSVGDKIYVEKLDAEAGSDVTLDKVVFVGGEKAVAGTPYVAGATVTAKVESRPWIDMPNESPIKMLSTSAISMALAILAS